MEVLMPVNISARLITALEKAGENEIGGILLGECLSPGYFKIVDITIQTTGGSLATFIRNIQWAINSLKRFFLLTKQDYRRFNYLGEWHSHPSFDPIPSNTDLFSMVEIVEDTSVGATFVVLMIVRLNKKQCIEGTATFFIPGGKAYKGRLLIEG